MNTGRRLPVSARPGESPPTLLACDDSIHVSWWDEEMLPLFCLCLS